MNDTNTNDEGKKLSSVQRQILEAVKNGGTVYKLNGERGVWLAYGGDFVRIAASDVRSLVDGGLLEEQPGSNSRDTQYRIAKN